MKRPVVRIEYIPLNALLCDSPEAERKVHALRQNPFAESGEVLGRISGVCDGREVGGEYVFPLHLKTPIGVLSVLAGSTLFVDAAHRNCGLGMDLPELRWMKSPSCIALGASLSQMALPVHELLGYEVFRMPRYVMAWRSRAVLESKIGSLLTKMAAPIVDCALAVYAALLRLAEVIALRGVTVREVSPEDEASLKSIAELIGSDDSVFSEVHDERWLKWHLTESFSKDGPSRLMAAFDKDGFLGFCMVKRRFHAQASHRGFRNVWLGSVIEWQMRRGSEGKLGWLIAFAALMLRKEGVDAVEVLSADSRMQRFLRRLGWRRVGDGNLVIKAGDGAPSLVNNGMGEVSNWRLRPAMGDAGLS